MLSEQEFHNIKEKVGQYKYTSLTYVDFDDCKEVDNIIHNDNRLILLADTTKSPTMIYYATDDFNLVVETLKHLIYSMQINFIPQQYKQQLEDIGFTAWGEYIDFFNHNLAATPIQNSRYNEIEFLRTEDCELASIVSKRCAYQSRGFIGETSEWFMEWVNENDVIIIREYDVIVGFCCVSIYNNGSTLWVREVAVDPKHQGKGFGKKLLEQAICYGVTKGAVKGFLAADILNQNAIKLYNKYGFCSEDSFGELQMRRVSASLSTLVKEK